MAHKRLDFESLLINKTAVKGTLIDVDGPLLVAMKEGHWFALDESRLTPTDTMTSLNEIVENGETLVPGIRNRMLKAHPNFRFILLDNTGLRGDSTGQYGTGHINDISGGDRLEAFKTSYPTPAQEASFLVKAVKAKGKSGRNVLPSQYADAYVEMFNRIRKIHDGIPDDKDMAKAITADQTFSIRRGLRFALIMQEMGDLKPSEFPEEYDNHYEAALMEAGWLTADPAMALAVREIAKDILG